MNQSNLTALQCVLIMFVILAFSTFIHANPGALDTDFGRFGVDMEVLLTDMEPRAMALQPDGRIVVLGSNGAQIVVRRFRADGVADTSFSGDGHVSIDVGGTDEFGGSEPACFFEHSCGLALQEDGKIVVVADGKTGSNNDFAILRILPNGALDTGFAINGKAMVDFDGGSDSPSDVGIQTDGKIIMVGSVAITTRPNSTSSVTIPRFGVTRLNSDGSLDTSFGEGGKATVPFEGGLATGRAMAIQSDGKIVIVGTAKTSGDGPNKGFGIARFNTDGSLDQSFSSDGYRVFQFSGPTRVNSHAMDVTIESPGSIMVSGYVQTDSDTETAAYLIFNSSGDPVDGSIITGTSAVLGRFASGFIQRNTRIILAGDDGENVFLSRLKRSNASLDLTFNHTGKMPVSAGTARDFLVLPDGNFLVLGSNGITRLSQSGADSEGFVFTSFGFGNDRAFDIAVQDDGKAVVVGAAEDVNQFVQKVAVARYEKNGQLDQTFGNQGIVLLRGPDFRGAGYSVTIQDDGRILIAGYDDNDNQDRIDSDFALYRLHENGDLDLGGSAGGFIEPTFPLHVDFGIGNDVAVSVLQQVDGKIVLVGYAEQQGIPNFTDRYGIALVRYLPNGNLDPTFNGTGKVVTLIPQGFDTTRANNAMLLSNGKILVAGTHDEDVLVLRYNANGSLDETFGSGGIVLTGRFTAGGARTVDIGYDLGIIQNDHIAVGGLVDSNKFGALILGPDGGQCKICGTLPVGEQYWLPIDLTGSSESARSMAVEPDGKIILAGHSDSDQIALSTRIRRKSLIQGPGFREDTSYGGEFARPYEVGIHAVELYGRGILMAGYMNNGNDDDFFLIKMDNLPKQNLTFSNSFED